MHKPKNVSCLHTADVVAMPITSETGRNVSPDACQKVLHVNCINTAWRIIHIHWYACIWYDLKYCYIYMCIICYYSFRPLKLLLYSKVLDMFCNMQIPYYKRCMIKLSSFHNKLEVVSTCIIMYKLCVKCILKQVFVSKMYVHVYMLWYTYFTINHLSAVECVKIWCWLTSPIQNVVHHIILKTFLHAWWWIAMGFFLLQDTCTCNL